MSKLEELQDERTRLNIHIWEIERRESDKRNATLIGKCFRYSNSFGSGESWWLYVKIIGAVDGNLISRRFQTDCRGRMEVEPEHTTFTDLLNADYEEISSKDFDTAWIDFKATIKDIK